MIVRLRKPRATALIFESGSVSMSGLTSVEDVRRASRRFTRRIQRAGYKVSVRKLVIQNIAMSTSVPWRLDLTKLTDVLENRVNFSESQAAASVVGDGSKRFKYFYTGAIIVTGYKDINEANNDYEFIVSVANLIKK